MPDKKSTKDKKKDNLKKYEALQKQCDEYLASWKRAQADYENLQKEVVQDQQKYMRRTRISFIMQLLPVYNHFMLAFEHLPFDLQNNEWVIGISHIKDQLSRVFEEFKVKKIETHNKAFNASLHEAVSQEKHEDKESGMIVKEVSPGYEMGGEVIVPSKVVVAE